MKLLNTGPGEWSDRLTILSLKILISEEQGKEATHFHTEQTALLQQIRGRTLNGRWFEKVLELAAVNGQLWQAEDRMRALRDHPVSQPNHEYVTFLHIVMEVAFRIQALNDRRAALVQQINADAGETVQPEKL